MYRLFLSLVVEENPSADYDTITKLVQEKWARLSDTNKQHFCMVGKDELEVLKKTVVEKKKLSQKIKRKPVVQVGISSENVKFCFSFYENLLPTEHKQRKKLNTNDAVS